MIELVLGGSKTGFDIAKAFPVGRLEGIPGDEIFNTTAESNLPAGLLSTEALHSSWVTEFSTGGVTLNVAGKDPATVTKVAAGEFPRWRVDYDGNQYFICKEPSGDTTKMSIRGENRLYELLPQMFAFEIVGMLKVSPDQNWGSPHFEMSGGFYLKITTTRFEVFAIAQFRHPIIGSMSVKGLLIMTAATAVPFVRRGDLDQLRRAGDG